VFAAAGLALAIAGGTAAWAQQGDRRELLLPPIEFAPANNASGYVVEQGGLGRLCATKGSGYFVAPLHVRDGAVIERIAVTLTDANPDAFGVLSLVGRGAEAFEVLAITAISAGGGEIEELAADGIKGAVVDSQRNRFVLQALLTGPRVCLHGARVTYRTP
jgi:hypothetical protein